MTGAKFVYVACASEEEARAIARALVEERLAACGNILAGMKSIYRWQGAMEEAEECLLILKTHSDCLDRLIARAKALHSYEIPGIVVLDIVQGLPDYLGWIAAETRA